MKKALCMLALVPALSFGQAAHDIFLYQVNAAGTNYNPLHLSDPNAGAVLVWNDTTNTVEWGAGGAAAWAALTGDPSDSAAVGATGEDLMAAASAAAGRSTLGLGTADNPTFAGVMFDAGNIVLSHVTGDFSLAASGGDYFFGLSAGTDPQKVHIHDGGADNEPGALVLYQDDGTAQFFFVDSAGNLRRHSAFPTDDDSDGTVIGSGSIPDDTITAEKFADDDWGPVSISSNVFTLDTNGTNSAALRAWLSDESGAGVFLTNTGDGTFLTVETTNFDGNFSNDSAHDGIGELFDIIDEFDLGIGDVVDDTTPQLGGSLDVNGSEITGAIDLHTTGSITAQLSDDAGASALNILNDTGATVASIDSLGAQSVSGVNADRLDYNEQASITDPAAGKSSIYQDSDDDNLHVRFGAGDDVIVDTGQTGTVTGAMLAEGAQFDAWIIAASDETTALTTTGTKVTFLAPYAATVVAIEASVTTAPTGASLIVDVHEDGSTLMATNKCEIEATETKTLDATTAPAETDTAIAQWATITIHIDQIGSTVAGAGLKVYIIHTH